MSKVFVLDSNHQPLDFCHPGQARRLLKAGHAPRAKYYLGFQTGDMVRANVPKGKYAGTYTGRIAIRYRPSFRLNGFDVHPKHLVVIHKADGYEYSF